MKLSDRLSQQADEVDQDEAPSGTTRTKPAERAPARAARKPSTRSTTSTKTRTSGANGRAGQSRSSRASSGRGSDVAARDDGRPSAGGDAVPRRTARKGQDEQRWREDKRKVRELVLAEVAPELTGPEAPSGEDLEDLVSGCVDRILRGEDVSVSPAERQRFVRDVCSDILGYGPLDELLADPSVSEVMCNSHDEVWVERDGRVERTDVRFSDRDQYRQVIERIVSAVGRRVDESSPMVDARLPDGSRVNAIVPPLALRGPVLTIRRFSEDPFDVQDLIRFGSLSDDLAVVLEACVRGRLSMLVSGGTATGKTTLLNVLSRFIPEHERIITIEDAAELRLQQPHIVTLEARPANAEGSGEVTIRDLVKNALRMRPDRIIVGECRGGEALDMLQAMNTGHEGSLTTIHANSARDALSRLETLVLMAGMELPEKAIREQIVAAIDVIVQIQRLPDGQRRVTSVQEVQGMEEDVILLQELFAHRPEVDAKGRHVGQVEPTGLRPKFLEGLQAQGIDVPSAVLRPASAQRRATNGRRRR